MCNIQHYVCILEDLNILLVGAGDIRHVMLTIAKSYRRHKRKIHVSNNISTLEANNRTIDN